MLRIMLVDDEPFFHSTFLSLVDWEALGCTVAFQAENGQQAISMLAQDGVDVLFTDMVMPVVNGVELIRYVRREYPRIQCYALSSFDDFAYVRQSLKEGARDYLLKHTLTRSALEEILRDLGGAEAGRGVPAGAGLGRAAFEEMFVSMLKRREAEPEVLARLIGEAKVDFPRPPLLAVCVRIQDISLLHRRFASKDRFQQFLTTAAHIAQSALENYGQTLCLTNRFDTIYALVSNERFSGRLFSQQSAHMVKRSLTSILNRYCNIDVSIAAGACSDGYGGVLPAFLQLEDSVAARAGEDVLRERGENAPVVSVRLDTERAILQDMRQMAFEDVRSRIVGEFEACVEAAPSVNAIRHMSMEFLNLLNRICSNEGMRLEPLFGTDASPYALVAGMSSLNEMQTFIVDAYRCLFEQLRASSGSENRIVQNALRVIHNCYGEDLSLTEVADRIHCNSTYLSRVFKAETGKGFLQYLTAHRLSQACKLMDRRELSLREIAARTGFSSYSYFFKIFRQFMGTTPQLYMKHRNCAALEEDGANGGADETKDSR